MRGRLCACGRFDVPLHRHAAAYRSVHEPLGISSDAFLRSVRIWIENEVRHLAVLSATDHNAFPKPRVRLRVRLMVGDVERVVLVDKHSARPTELLPLFEKFSILIE